MDDRNSDDEAAEEPKRGHLKVKISPKRAGKRANQKKVKDETEEGEVSSDEKEFDDGLDEDLMGNEDDRDYLEGLTEKEREEVNYQDGYKLIR